MNLSGEQATIFALVCVQETVSAIDARIAAGLPSLRSAQEVLDQLERQVLIECVTRRPRPTYILAAHLCERLREGAVAAGLVITFEQPALIDQFEDAHWQIVQYCDDQSRTATSIAKILNMRSNTRFNQAYLYPLITAGLLQIVDETQPEQRRTYTLMSSA